MEESKYWNRFWTKKVNRRRLIAGTALTGSGLAAAAVVGCGGADSGPSTNGNGATGGPASSGDGFNDISEIPSVDPVDARRYLELDASGQYLSRPTAAPPEGSTGGTLTYIGFDAVVLDRYDPHQTQFGPMYSNLSAVFSKLYMYSTRAGKTSCLTWRRARPR